MYVLVILSGALACTDSALSGDAGVGKTSMTRRFVDQTFDTSYVHTIGLDFHEKVLEFGSNHDHQNSKVRLQIWDTAGQER